MRKEKRISFFYTSRGNIAVKWLVARIEQRNKENKNSSQLFSVFSPSHLLKEESVSSALWHLDMHLSGFCSIGLILVAPSYPLTLQLLRPLPSASFIQVFSLNISHDLVFLVLQSIMRHFIHSWHNYLSQFHF